MAPVMIASNAMLHLGIPGANSTTKEKRFRQVWQQDACKLLRNNNNGNQRPSKRYHRVQRRKHGTTFTR
ncbi:hypothetical protein NC652_005563 [Populus alba x Populus x berolinensis]|nr:hypothetical protein NC652_005563 [Populus alba x Populus x berolinensis]